MKLLATTFACALTASTASMALASDNASLPAAGGQNSGSTSVTVEPANAVVASGTAQVINQTGAVTRVNRGDGLVELTTGADLSVGDTVFAGPGSSVTLYYPATGCEYVVPAETYFAVAATAPCSASAGAAGGLQKSATSSAAISSDSDDDTKTALIVGGAVVVGGGILAIVALSGDDDDNDNDNPVSPN